MNNLIKRRNLLTPEIAASLIPFSIASGMSVLLTIFFVLPQYIKSNKVNLELNGLIKKKNQLDNLKLKYKIVNQKVTKLNNEKSKIIEIISGTSNLDTFLAKLGELGKKNNIEFVSITPKKIKNFIDNSSKENKDKNNLANLRQDSLLVEGTKKYVIEFSLKTYFINLLAFLRELEFQDNVILVDNMTLKLDEQSSYNKTTEKSQAMLEVKIRMKVYGKI